MPTKKGGPLDGEAASHAEQTRAKKRARSDDTNVLEQSPWYETDTEDEELDGLSRNTDGSSSETEEPSDEEEDLRGEPGKTRADDSTAFGRAFQKIMRKKLPLSGHNDAMGPILSAHKQLVAKKLEEVEEGRKKRSESKKIKQALREKGHFVPPSYVTANEKELIRLATKGVVKLFNAVSKVQSLEAGAKNAKKTEAKELAKRNKSTFLSMLQGANGSTFEEKKQSSNNKQETMARQHQPGWSALQDTFMLGKARLKDWDKKQDDEIGLERTGDSSDDSD